MFIEEALCVALHPSAHSVLVGFTDKLRLFTVLLDDFKCGPSAPLISLLCEPCVHPHVHPSNTSGCQAAVARSLMCGVTCMQGCSANVRLCLKRR